MKYPLPRILALVLSVAMACLPDSLSAQQALSVRITDRTGAVIAGAVVQVRGTDGSVQRTMQADRNGSFVLAGLAAGDYRLVVTNPGFETKEIPVAIGASGAPVLLRIVLAVGHVNTTIDVHGRAGDLVGLSDSAGQVMVGAEELKNRPMLRSGEILETLPGLIITQHAGGGKANQYFMRGFNLDHGTDFAIFLDGMPLNLPSHAHGEGYSDMNTVIPELVERIDARERSVLRRRGRLWFGGKCRCGVLQDAAPGPSRRWMAACTSLRDSSSAHRESWAKAICYTAERRTTMAAHGCIRTITTNSTAS